MTANLNNLRADPSRNPSSSLYGGGASSQPVADNARDPKGTRGPGGEATTGPLGVDLALLETLPQNLRGRLTDALYSLQDAMRSGNAAAASEAAANLTVLLGELQNFRADAEAGKLFKFLTHPSQRQDADDLAQRAGVEIDGVRRVR